MNINEKITIKDVPKERMLSIASADFSETKALEMITQGILWLAQRGVGITDLPLAIVNEDKTFEVYIPIKEEKIKEEGDYKIKILPAHRIGAMVHEEPEKPLSFTQDFLERQLKYNGFALSRPYRYVFHQNTQNPAQPLIEIQIPIHK